MKKTFKEIKTEKENRKDTIVLFTTLIIFLYLFNVINNIYLLN